MIDARTLHARLRAARADANSPEIALLDIREPGEFKDGHLLLASNAPLSQLEWLAPRLLPRHDVSVVLCSDRASDPRLARAANQLQRWGYSQVRVLNDDFSACEQAGFVVFTGFNVPSKAFGEWLERRNHTPHIAANDLAQRLHDDTPPLVLDCRPADEHARGAVPGAANLPGVEMARRAEALDPTGKRPIVVHCAGRTRGIVATQSLIDLGYSNPVQVLENGLMGWQLTGHALANTEAEPLGAPDEPPSEDLLNRARRFADRRGAQQWTPQTPSSGENRTTYGFTVGTAAEAAQYTPPGFHHVPGGQLQQGLDDHVAIQGARLVIHAPDDVRAALAAGYLRQMGWQDVWWFSGEASGGSPVVSQVPAPPQAQVAEHLRIRRPDEWNGDDALVLDLGNSRRYAERHLPGARFAVRALLPDVLPLVSGVRRVLLTCDDGELSLAAHAEVAALFPGEVLALEGGVAAWEAAGGPLSSEGEWLSPAIDVATTPYDYKGDLTAQMQAYIDWELALEGNVERDGVLRFQDASA